ncbi:hypothetical protein EON63_21015 [archaeon]|nr:MAG: hypothetical protein EON63_21015 [archaeon]
MSTDYIKVILRHLHVFITTTTHHTCPITITAATIFTSIILPSQVLPQVRILSQHLAAHTA